MHDSEIEGNKMHGSENEGKHMVVKMRGMKCMGKETEGRKLKVMGGRHHQEAKSRGQRSWCWMPRGGFAGCQGVALIL